ncbi:unnamed protein product [Protopolystoma xenopodis]|uniref:Uncharacterized protein n=1 Tax=Protopolystoma xenopodis TaxID=117903 RepID=A0A3S5CL86_9PLAT|nr:unnamed protein product [Protopolystoma xenopodis]
METFFIHCLHWLRTLIDRVPCLRPLFCQALIGLYADESISEVSSDSLNWPHQHGALTLTNSSQASSLLIAIRAWRSSSAQGQHLYLCPPGKMVQPESIIHPLLRRHCRIWRGNF